MIKIFRKNKKSKYDQRLVDLIQSHNIDHVFDVGANIGQYATSIRQAGFDKKITSFEPLSSNHKILNIASNKDQKWVIADQMAIGAAVGTADINISADNDMSSILDIEDQMVAALPKAEYTSTETVTVKTIDTVIDEYCAKDSRLFLKVDTQGFEKAVIDGAIQSFENSRIHGVQLELSMLPLYKGEPTYEILCDQMHKLGYETHFIIPGFFSKKINRQLQADFIFFKTEK
jgi:FkbM family methyltransferase